jgi:hypothetical protein
MNKEHFHTILGSLSGRLTTGSSSDEREIQKANRLLSRSLVPDDIQQLKASSFAFENADLFAIENVTEERLYSLRSVLEKQGESEPEYRAFVRETPVRSTQLHASVPSWAEGAQVEQTVGPFTSQDGRQFWFDFFKIEKLVALYVQNQPNPALLFKVRSGIQFISRILPPSAQTASSYNLPSGSIWINSQLFAANAPAGYYTGLTIKGGVITISIPPQTINGKLTVSPNAVVTVKLQLNQPGVNDADPSSPYGVDARDASLQLPASLSFHFSGAGRTIDEIPNAQWDVFGHIASFEWTKQGAPTYDNVVKRILIPFKCSRSDFEIASCKSPFHKIAGEAPIKKSAWALTSAPIDILHPTPAAGIGGLLIACGKGLTNEWKGLEGGQLNLVQPSLLAEPGAIAMSDFGAGNIFCQQIFQLWKDEQNPFGTAVAITYPQKTPFFYFTFANGNETLMVLGHADVQIDRPVTVAGGALAIRSKNSLLILSASKSMRLIYLFDENILVDSIDLTVKPPVLPKPIALALNNALFKVTPVNSCVLFGRLDEDFVKVTHGHLFTGFGVFAYLPTLPDPYAANLGALRFQFRGRDDRLNSIGGTIWLWLICRVRWEPANEEFDEVEVSFHFAPLQGQAQQTTSAVSNTTSTVSTGGAQPVLDFRVAPGATGPQDRETEAGEDTQFNRMARFGHGLPDYGEFWDKNTSFLQQEYFSLLDVSTNADLFGISFGTFGERNMLLIRTHSADNQAQDPAAFPLQVKGMDVVSRGSNVRAFTVPPISWEPVFNLSEPQRAGDPNEGFNYYPDDGGPTRILNTGADQVALAPIPLTDYLVETFKIDDNFAALASFTLPFGLRALALLQNDYEFNNQKRLGTKLLMDPRDFPGKIRGGRQLEMYAGNPLVQGEGKMFVGCTMQENNVLEMDGSAQGNSTLGASVTTIFNFEFMPKNPGDILRQRGVPLTRMDLSGYGASIFSNWLNPKATIAATSQAKFDVFVGRCSHEVIQVKSILYPWGIRVVRTITLFRTSTNYVFRHDSGWKAESDGKYDFAFYVNIDQGDGTLKPEFRSSPFEIHPGVVKGLYNVKEIKETEDIKPFEGPLVLKPGDKFTDEETGEEATYPDPTKKLASTYQLWPVYFNADVDIENPVSGFVAKDGSNKKLVPSKRILGFVQLAPRGFPITKELFRELIKSQQGSIGGPIDTVVNIANSNQQMRLNRFDVSNSVRANGIDPIFVASGRGNVLLPKDGSWSLVKHEQGLGEISPVPEDLSVPLIRIGRLISQNEQLILEPGEQLLRIANPTEILRAPVNDTINYGFLLSTDTQKALFLTPAFKQGSKMLLSKTPPLFVDAFRIVNSKAIFPKVGNAINNFGDAISLYKKGTEFFENPSVTDAGKKVLEVMDIAGVPDAVGEAGYKLKKLVDTFDLPTTAWDLINIGGDFRIYIEYKADKVQKPGGEENLTGSLDFNVNSFANDVAERWKSRMSNVGLVVDLCGIERLMTIKGNWDAKKGSEAQYGGGGGVPQPQIEFASELQPIIDILEILQSLSGDDYAGAFGKGLKLAMSNKAGTWEYKFEASKEIPCVRFPPGPAYDSPQAPLKLEAGLKLGAYFNAALKVTTDPTQLLPTAGGYMGFYGRLSVMCVSLAAATVYAVGQVNVDIGADTKSGAFLKLKFGFGAQIVVGLPVIANVSVLFMVGIEMYVDASQLRVSGFLLFQGHAEILGGLVSVTITIEAKGTVAKDNGPPARTDMAAQVTFALEITVFWIIDIEISESWEERRQIA